MARSWQEVKKTITSELLSRNLKEPRLRLAALDSIEGMLGQIHPGYRTQTDVLLSTDEAEMRERLGALKEGGALNGAEISVLHNVYQVLRGELPSRGPRQQTRLEHRIPS